MSQVMLINPRRKRRVAKKASRRKAIRRNPKTSYKTRRRWSIKPKVSRRRRSVALMTNPRRKHRRKLRRNPKGLSSVKGFLNHTLIPGSVGAVGALGLDVALSFVPLPAALNTGMFKPVVRLAGAALLGLIAGKVMNRRVGEQVAAGATIVVLYDVFKGIAQTALPALPLSGLEFYAAGQPVGMAEYMTLPQPAASVVMPMANANNLSEYMYQ